MKLIDTKDGTRSIVDNSGKVTAQKKLDDKWRRTFPANEYSQAPTEQQSVSSEIVHSWDMSPIGLRIASRPIYDNDFSQVKEMIQKHGLSVVARSMMPTESALLAKYLAKSGDVVSALAVREAVMQLAYGSHIFTSDPEAEMRKFDDTVYSE